MASLAEFNIGLSLIFDTSSASSNAKLLSQNLTEVRTNTTTLVQEFPQLNQVVNQAGIGLQTLGQNTQQAGQSIQTLDTTLQQNRLEFDGMAQSVSAIGTPLQTLSQQTTEYSGVLQSTGQAVQNFESSSANLESSLGGVLSTVQQSSDSFSDLGNSVNTVEPSLRQLDSGITEIQGGLTQTNTVTQTTEQSFTQLTGAVRNMQPAFTQATQSSRTFGSVTLQLGSQLAGLTALGVGLINNILNLERVYLRAERAQIQLDKATRLVLVAEKSLDDLIIRSSVNTEAVTVARQELSLATEELNSLIQQGILEGEQYEQTQLRVQEALAKMAISLEEAGVSTDTVNLAVTKLSTALENQHARAVAAQIAEDQKWQAHLNLVSTAFGALFSAISSGADLIKLFSDHARFAAGSANLLAAATRGLTVASNALGISVKTLLIGTGVGVGLLALGYLLQGLLPSAHAAGGSLEDMGSSAVGAADNTDILGSSLDDTTEKMGKAKEGAELLKEALELLAETPVNVGALPTTPEDRDLIAKALEGQNITPVKPDFPVSNIPGTQTFIGPTTGQVPDLSKGTILAPGTKTVTVPPPTSGSSTATVDAKQLESKANEELSNTTQALLADKIAEAKAYDANLDLYRKTLAAKFPERLVTEEGALAYAKLNNEMISGTIPSYEEYTRRLNEALPLIQHQSHELQTVTPFVTSLTAEQWKLIEAEAEAHNKRMEAIQGNAMWVQGLFGTVAATQMAGETTTMYETRMARLAVIARSVTQEEDAYIDSLIRSAVELDINVTRQEELHAAMLNGKEGLQDLILTEQTLTDVLNDGNRAIELRREGLTEGRLAAVQFYDQTVKQVAFDAQYRNDLILIANSYGIQLPQGIRLTIEQLEGLIVAQETTGSSAKELAVIHNEAFASMHERVQTLVDAAVQGGDDWRKAWKELDKEFIPKKERDEVKDFLEDLADVQQVLDPLTEATSLLHSMTDAGIELSESEINRWADEFGDGLKDVKDELNDIHDKNLVGDVFDPLIALTEQDLSQTQLDALAKHIEMVNTALDDGTTAQELEDLAAATRGFAMSMIAPGEPGSPETGSLEEFEDVSAFEKGQGLFQPLVDGLTGENGLKPALEDTNAVVDTVKENMETTFNETVPAALNTTSMAALGLLSILGALTGEGGGGGNGITDVVFGSGGAFSTGRGSASNFSREFGNLFAPGSEANGVQEGGGGTNPFDRQRFEQIPISSSGNGQNAGGMMDTLIQMLTATQEAIDAWVAHVSESFNTVATAVSEIVGVMAIAVVTQIEAMGEGSLALVLDTTEQISESANVMAEAVSEIVGVMAIAVVQQIQAMGEGGLELTAEFNSAVQEQFSVLYEFVTEVAEQLVEDVNESFTEFEMAEVDISDFEDSLEDAVDAAEDAVDRINDALSEVNSLSEARGGVLSFAHGGLIRAQSGLIDTTIGPRTVLFGDNPTGIETHAFIPHNDPWPTMGKLLRMFGGSRISMGGGGGQINLNANINVYTADGQFLGTARVRKKFAFQNLEAH